MKEILLDALEALGQFSSDQLRILENEVNYMKLAKGEIVLHQGKICQAFYFVAQGALMQYKLNESLEMDILDLHTDNDWAFDHKSFTSQNPSDRFIQAYQLSQVFELIMDSVHRLIGGSHSFFQLGRILEQGTARSDLLENHKTPDERYLNLITSNPKVVQKFPLKIIASYLGVSPETLSRVRKRIK